MSFPTITSPGNERVKRAARLRRAAARHEQNRTLIDGVREFSAAVKSGVVLEEVFFNPELLAAEHRALLTDVARGGAHVFAASPAVLKRLAFGERNEGVVAVAVPPRRQLGEVSLPGNPLVAVLEGVEKPGNLGAVVRTADAAGISAVIAVDPGTDLYNPNAIRASLGTIFHLPLATATAEAALDWLRERGLQLVAARVDGRLAPWEVDFARPTAVVLGAEATGLGAEWSAADIVPVRLPMRGMADSLNVSATAAVLFYEALRQRS